MNNNATPDYRTPACLFLNAVKSDLRIDNLCYVDATRVYCLSKTKKNTKRLKGFLDGV